ncbi:MAG: hypothetical protein ACRCZQ_00440 [Bacteroidales bacterium]
MQQSQDGNNGITGEELNHFFLNPEESSITISQLEELIEKYPAFTAARLALVKKLQLTHHSGFVSNIQKTVVLLSDKRQLFQLLADKHVGWNEVFELARNKEQSKKNDTITTNDALLLIESFLNKDSVSKNQKETSEARIHTTPVSDSIDELELEKEVQSSYAALNYVNNLLSADDNSDETPETNTNPLEHQDLIDKFISFSDDDNSFRSTLSQVKQESEYLDEYPEETDDNAECKSIPEPSEDDLLTESLAKIYIKQKRYEKALEIIKSLSLKYPKKSVYFADQIRYLELLIANIKK